jgi:hypothetical protein
MKYVLMDSAGADGGDGGGGTPPAAPPAAAPPAAFDWKAAGLDVEGLAVVNDRQWKTPADLVTSYRNLEKLTGVPPEQIVKLPKGMDPALMGEVYDKLGRPKSPAEYKLAETETPYMKAIAEAMHEAGLNTVQAKKLADKQNAFIESENTRLQKEYEQKVSADINSMKSEWLDKYDSNIAVAKKAAAAFGMTVEQVNALEKTLGFAGTTNFLYNIGAKIGEAEFVQNGGQPGEFAGMSVESARGQLDILMKDRSFVQRFNSKDPVVRGEARALKERLTKIAYP